MASFERAPPLTMLKQVAMMRSKYNKEAVGFIIMVAPRNE
jgi:hypothetical protein